MIIPDIIIDYYLKNANKYHKWIENSYLEESLKELFDTGYIFCIESNKQTSRWTIEHKYGIRSGKDTNERIILSIVENYEPSYNDIDNDDFVYLQFIFSFQNIDGTTMSATEEFIDYLETTIYEYIQNELSLLSN